MFDAPTRGQICGAACLWISLIVCRHLNVRAEKQLTGCSAMLPPHPEQIEGALSEVIEGGLCIASCMATMSLTTSFLLLLFLLLEFLLQATTKQVSKMEKTTMPDPAMIRILTNFESRTIVGRPLFSLSPVTTPDSSFILIWMVVLSGG